MTVNAPTTVCNLDVQAGGNVVMNSNLDVTGALTLGNSINTSASTLGLGCLATVSGASSSIFVTGNVRKDFCSTGGFSFPVGHNGYTPVDANVTTLTINPSSLTARSLDATLIGFDPAQSISRNWQLEEAGDLTATLLFTYLAADVNGTEANYRVWRRQDNGTTTDMCGAPCVNTTNKTVGPVAGVTTFSRWTGAGPLAPTAANVSVSGRVVTANGNGIRNVRVTLTGQDGSVRTAITTSFGYYRFNDVASGETYVLNANSKRYTFTPRTISVTDELTDVDLIALP